MRRPAFTTVHARQAAAAAVRVAVGFHLQPTHVLGTAGRGAGVHLAAACTPSTAMVKRGRTETPALAHVARRPISPCRSPVRAYSSARDVVFGAELSAETAPGPQALDHLLGAVGFRCRRPRPAPRRYRRSARAPRSSPARRLPWAHIISLTRAFDRCRASGWRAPRLSLVAQIVLFDAAQRPRAVATRTPLDRRPYARMPPRCQVTAAPFDDDEARSRPLRLRRRLSRPAVARSVLATTGMSRSAATISDLLCEWRSDTWRAGEQIFAHCPLRARSWRGCAADGFALL